MEYKNSFTEDFPYDPVTPITVTLECFILSAALSIMLFLWTLAIKPVNHTPAAVKQKASTGMNKNKNSIDTGLEKRLAGKIAIKIREKIKSKILRTDRAGIRGDRL